MPISSAWCAVRTDADAPLSAARRRWLAGLVAGGALPVAAWGQGVASAGAQLAGAQPAGAATGFDAATLDGAMQALGGVPVPASGVVLTVADVVDDGAHAAVKVVSTLPGTSEMALVVEMNPNPLVVRFSIPPGTVPEVAVRIKLAQSGPVWAVVRAQGRLYCTSRNATVTTGACAG